MSYVKQQTIAEQKIVTAFGDPSEGSGIYIFWRYSEGKLKHCYYVGQAKNLRRRIAQHILIYDHLGISLRKHGLFDANTNPSGWTCSWELVEESRLDEIERHYIAKYMADDGTELYNITSGGQGKGKADINPRAERKGYYTGKECGYKKAYTEIALWIEKYTNGLSSKGGAIADRKTAELIEKLKEAVK